MAKSRKPRQRQTGDEEADREERRGAGQNVGRAAAGHKAAGRADKTAALGFLQQNHPDQAEDKHEVDDNNDSQHR